MTTYNCPYCRSYFPTDQSLQVHLINSHPRLSQLDPTGKKSRPHYNCRADNCDRKFLSYKGRIEHERNFHDYNHKAARRIRRSTTSRENERSLNRGSSTRNRSGQAGSSKKISEVVDTPSLAVEQVHEEERGRKRAHGISLKIPGRGSRGNKPREERERKIMRKGEGESRSQKDENGDLLGDWERFMEMRESNGGGEEFGRSARSSGSRKSRGSSKEPSPLPSEWYDKGKWDLFFK